MLVVAVVAVVAVGGEQASLVGTKSLCLLNQLWQTLAHVATSQATEVEETSSRRQGVPYGLIFCREG
jgi:hypothetical protein